MARQPREFTFSDEKIEALATPRERTEYADKGQPGLRLRVGPNARTFIFYSRDENGKRTLQTIGRWSRSGLGGTFNVAGARARFLDARGAERGHVSITTTVGELLDLFIKRGQCSDYTADILRKHVEPARHLVAATLAPVVLSDLVANVQAGFKDDTGKAVGGPAVADKVRGGLRSMFAWAQRQGRFPQDRPLPTLGLVREDFADIGWKPRERVPSERELHQLLDVLGIGTGERLEIDTTKSPRIPLATRLAVLLVMHVPVRSGAGALSQPAGAADLDAQVLRWRTRKGGREEELETPLSGVAVEIVKQLRQLEGGSKWLVPSPDNPGLKESEHRPIDLKALARMFVRLQSPGSDGEPPRVRPDEGAEPFTPHALRALWTTLAGDLGIDDGIAVRVIGHKPEGASAAHRFYDRSLRLDAQREAVERVSAELERIRRRIERPAAPVTPLRVSGQKA
jgi:integrase